MINVRIRHFSMELGTFQIGSIPLPINHKHYANHDTTVNIINIMQLMLEEYYTYPSFTWAFKGHF